VNYREGGVVQVGTPMFTIDDRPFRADAERALGDYENAIAQLAKNRADVARYTPLVAARAISREQLDDARASVRGAQATVRAQHGALQTARLNLAWTRVRAPIQGLAGIAQARVGSLVNSSNVLTQVSTLDPIRASVNISEREYLRYAEIMNRVNAPEYASRRYLELVLIDGSVHPYGAQRVIVNRQIDPTTGTLLVQTLFPNPGNILRPGMFARLRAHTRVPTEVLLVPEIAVEQLPGQNRVSVVDAQGRVEGRAVQLGPLIDHAFVVQRGLHAGERVVVEGHQVVRLQPGARVVAQLVPALQVGPQTTGGGPGDAGTDGR
jgi:membrane fusion protein (multidrug efflux system)